MASIFKEVCRSCPMDQSNSVFKDAGCSADMCTRMMEHTEQMKRNILNSGAVLTEDEYSHMCSRLNKSNFKEAARDFDIARRMLNKHATPYYQI